MRTVLSAVRITTLLPATIDVGMYARLLDTLTWRSVMSTLGWIVVGIVPLVSFDAGGGQTAVEILRYIVFRGIDRDAWYVISGSSMIAGALSASAVPARPRAAHSGPRVEGSEAFGLWWRSDHCRPASVSSRHPAGCGVRPCSASWYCRMSGGG